MKNICIAQNDFSESIALIGEILGSAGINIEGLSIANCSEHRVIRFLVEDDVAATQVIEKAGIRISEVNEVFILHKDKKLVTGKPGSFGGICRLFEKNGIRINFGYPAENNRFVFGVDNVKKAQELMA